MPRAPELSEGRLQVAAGILIDTRGRLLLSDRSRAESMREFWEFPGGKRLAGESAEAALSRELCEELGIEVTSCDPFHCLVHDYPELSVEIDFYLVRTWRGTPRGLEGQELRWLRPEEISREVLLPADAPVLDMLKELP